MREFFRRIYYLLNRRKLAKALENDIAFHREMLARENQKDFGNPTLLREQAHDAWGWSWLDRVVQDVSFGSRLLRKAPVLACTAIAVLTLGIGVNVTVFNLTDVMLFKPLPVRDPHSIVRLTTAFQNGSSTQVVYPAVAFYREHNPVFSTVLAQDAMHMTLGEDQTENVVAGLVTSNYFSDLGISASYGRLFDAAGDENPSAPPVVVLGHGFWQRRFGGDTSIVGKTIHVNQHPATVIGITPVQFVGLDFEHAERNDIWVVFGQTNYFIPENKLLTSFDILTAGVKMFGRLKPGVTMKAAEQALRPLAQELEREHPGEVQKGEHLVASPGGYAASVNANDMPIFVLLTTLVLLILVVACGNLGNLFLGHAVTREREIAIRLALGATRGRIMRQLMTESTVLAALGSGLGLLFSWYVSRSLVIFLGGPGAMDFSPDWRTMLFAFGIGTVASLLFGLSPARQLARQTHRKSRMRMVFMGMQVAASCVLLVVSGLLVRGLQRAFRPNLGFEYKQVVKVDPQLYAHAYKPVAAAQYMHDLESVVRQIPGVDSVGFATRPPLSNRMTMERIREGGVNMNLFSSDVDPGYFGTMSIALVRGRNFVPGDKNVAIIGESAARQLWPGQDPLGKSRKVAGQMATIVGVSATARTMGLSNGDSGEVYRPLSQADYVDSVMLVKTSRPPEQVAGLISGASRSLDRTVSPEVQLLKDAFRDKVQTSEAGAALTGGMGILALLLAVIGLYGVISYNVAQRKKEIGIRMALGAQPSNIVQSLVSRFFLPFSVALALGLALAGAMSVVLRSELYGLNNFDPVSYLSAAALLLAVGSLASLVPARRALRVNPVEALRCE